MGDQYGFTDGCHLKGNAQNTGEELLRLRAKYGGDVEASQVVQAARRDSSPLHDYFDWDDSVAAHEYRLGQARYLIRSVRIIRHENGEVRKVRLFTVIREQQKPGVYTTLEAALKDPERRPLVLNTALRELEAFQEKYQELSELSAVFRAIEKVRLDQVRRA